MPRHNAKIKRRWRKREQTGAMALAPETASGVKRSGPFSPCDLLLTFFISDERISLSAPSQRFRPRR